MKKFVSGIAVLFFLINVFVYSDSPNGTKKFVSLVPALTEIVFSIGAQNNLVGITRFCNYPEETKYIEKVGGFSGALISIESIILLRPDFVLVSKDMHFRIIDLLDQVGIASVAFEPKNMEDIFSCIETIGNLTGCEDGASLVISQMKEKLDKAKSLSAGKEKVSVFWEIWDNPLMTSGPHTFINEAILLAGGKNIFDDVIASWPEVSVEQVILRNPDWIISGSDHEAQMNRASLLKRPGWSAIGAVRNNRIAVLDADMIMRAGPRLADAILRLAEILYGDAGQR